MTDQISNAQSPFFLRLRHASPIDKINNEVDRAEETSNIQRVGLERATRPQVNQGAIIKLEQMMPRKAHSEVKWVNGSTRSRPKRWRTSSVVDSKKSENGAECYEDELGGATWAESKETENNGRFLGRRK